MLYMFAGYPPSVSAEMQRLKGHAGATRGFVIQNEVGLLEESKSIQARKEGVFIIGEQGEEQLQALDVVFSPALQSIGFTLADFQESMAFGNGVTCNAKVGMVAQKAALDAYRVHVNDPMKGKRDFRDPQYTRNIWLSWTLFSHKLPEFAYVKLLRFMEGEDAMLPQYVLFLGEGRDETKDGLLGSIRRDVPKVSRALTAVARRRGW